MPIDTNLGLTAEQYYYYSGLIGPPFVPVPPELQRYFTRLMSSANAHYALGSPVNVTRVVMDVYSSSTANTGLPTGAPALTANQFQTIDFAHAGNIEYIGRNGSDYFNGYIANVRYYNGTTLLVDADINEDLNASTNVLNSVSGGVTITAVNVGANSTLFDQVNDGWTGPELWNGNLPTATFVPVIIAPTLSDVTYRYTISGFNEPSRVQLFNGSVWVSLENGQTLSGISSALVRFNGGSVQIGVISVEQFLGAA